MKTISVNGICISMAQLGEYGSLLRMMQAPVKALMTMIATIILLTAKQINIK